MSDTPDLDRILSEHINVGLAKPISYLPVNTIENVLKMRVGDYVRLVERAGGKCAVLSADETCIKSGAVYAYSDEDLALILTDNRELLVEHSWPQVPAEFVRRIAAEWFDDESPLRRLVDLAFGNHPISIKGVLIDRDCVLLLANERGEWDLPGGRPDAGEDHRAALKREVREESGLDVEVGAALDDHLFEVLPDRFVRIVAYACTLVGAAEVTLSQEHLDLRWVAWAELGDTIDGRKLPPGYLGAIRQAIDQPRSPKARVV